MPFPPAPWQMRGQAWLSVFRLRQPVDERHPAGVYAVALVDYQPESPLTYHELLVARAVGGRERRLNITDIWVDSSDSRDGGRALWALPKELAEFRHEERRWGPVTDLHSTACSAGHPVARCRFVDASRTTVRLPIRGGIWQPPIAEHTGEVTANLHGSARALPCWGSWEFATDGPLGWLAGRHPVMSARLADFRMTFG